MTQKCCFCGEVCFTIADAEEEGCVGMVVGNKIICIECLWELKDALEDL